jgi:hypothetical protein
MLLTYSSAKPNLRFREKEFGLLDAVFLNFLLTLLLCGVVAFINDTIVFSLDSLKFYMAAFLYLLLHVILENLLQVHVESHEL